MHTAHSRFLHGRDKSARLESWGPPGSRCHRTGVATRILTRLFQMSRHLASPCSGRWHLKRTASVVQAQTPAAATRARQLRILDCATHVVRPPPGKCFSPTFAWGEFAATALAMDVSPVLRSRATGVIAEMAHAGSRVPPTRDKLHVPNCGPDHTADFWQGASQTAAPAVG